MISPTVQYSGMTYHGPQRHPRLRRGHPVRALERQRRGELLLLLSAANCNNGAGSNPGLFLWGSRDGIRDQGLRGSKIPSRRNSGRGPRGKADASGGASGGSGVCAGQGDLRRSRQVVIRERGPGREPSGTQLIARSVRFRLCCRVYHPPAAPEAEMALVAMTTADTVDYVSDLDPAKTKKEVPLDSGKTRWSEEGSDRHRRRRDDLQTAIPRRVPDGPHLRQRLGAARRAGLGGSRHPHPDEPDEHRRGPPRPRRLHRISATPRATRSSSRPRRR